VFGDRHIRVVVENAAENIARFTRRAGDGLCAVDAVLIAGVGVKLQGAVVVPEIARVDAAKQAFPLDREALAIGREPASVAPDGAECLAVMVVDQDGVGGLERGVTQEPSAGVLQRVGGQRVARNITRQPRKVASAWLSSSLLPWPSRTPVRSRSRSLLSVALSNRLRPR